MKNFILLSLLLMMVSCTESYDQVMQYTAEQFFKTTNIKGGSFSEDDSKLLVSSDESGIFNLYEINIADGTKTQVTFSETESIFGIDYVPGTGEILYSSDNGGNEIQHIFLLKKDNTVVELTPEEDEVAIFNKWSDDNKYMYYTSTKRNPGSSDIYRMRVGVWKEELIFKNNEGYSIGGISGDGRYITLLRYISEFNHQLYLYNRDDKRTIKISDAEGSYKSSGFGKDNTSFYFTTNAGKEFKYLVEYKIESRTKTTIFETDWDVVESSLSKNGMFRAVLTNENSRYKLKLFNPATEEQIEIPDIDDRYYADYDISESELLIRMTLRTSKSPEDIYIYNIKEKSFEKLTESLNEDINPDDLVSAKVVRFKSFDDLDIPAFLYIPRSASRNNRVPAIIYAHGGPGGQVNAIYYPEFQYFVNHGYAILAVDNRGSSGYGKTFAKLDDLNHGDGDLKDYIWGKKWLQTLDYIDPQRIGILGDSYGGFITMAALTFAPEEFDVGINYFGVTNWIRTLKHVPPGWESDMEAIYAHIGNPYTNDSIRLYNISPLFHASNIKKPIIVLQGANDPRVLQKESDEIVEAARKNNVPVEYVLFPDEGHGFYKKVNQIEANKRVLGFLEKYLRGSNNE